MRRIYRDKRGIANVLGYLLSFSIASIIMTTAVIVTTGIIENRTAMVAGLQAQSIANKVADAIVEASVVGQSTEADYKKSLDIPLEIAGRSYYVEVTETDVYVNTTDGLVSKSCTLYGTGKTKLGVSGDRTYSGAGIINISINRSDVIYKFDFGKGNLSEHSPVEHGYQLVTQESSIERESEGGNIPWWNTSYQYRTSILVNNDSSEDLLHTPVKIVLSPSNFDYSRAYVNFTSSSNVTSDLVFVDTHFSVIADISINPSTWYTWWTRDYLVENTIVEITINSLTEGYDFDDIDWDTIKLNGISSTGWDDVAHEIYFDPEEVLLSIVDGEPREPEQHTVTVTGLLIDGAPFKGWRIITVTPGDILINDDFGSSTPGWGIDHFASIDYAMDDFVSEGDTVFVYSGTYTERVSTPYHQIRLIGQDRDTTIIQEPSNADDFVVYMNSKNDVTIDSFRIRGNAASTAMGIRASYSNNIDIINCKISQCAEGIRLLGSSDCRIMKCIAYNNHYTATDALGNGIALDGESHNNLIIDCIFYDNYADLHGDGIDLNRDASGNTIINCTTYNNQDDGISIDSAYNIIRNCTSFNNDGTGIFMSYVDECHHNEIINSTCYNDSNGETQRAGILIWASHNNLIDGCECYGHDSYGIQLTSQAYPFADGPFYQNTITRCHVHDNGDDGIRLMNDNNWSGTQDNKILYCDIHDNGGEGIEISRCKGGEINNCNIYDNDDAGIFFDAFSFPFFVNDTNCYNSGSKYQEYGIYIYRSTNIQITRCNLYNHWYDGISLKRTSWCKVTESNCFDNRDDGLSIIAEILIPSRFNTIEDNNFYCNGEGSHQGVGVFIGAACPLNTITHNNFAEQKNDHWAVVYNAVDNSLSNNWDGNYWDDYDCSGDHWIPPQPLKVDHNPRGPGCGSPYNNPDFIQVDKGYDETTEEDHYHRKTISSALTNVIEGGTVYVYGGSGTYYEDLDTEDAKYLIGDKFGNRPIIDGTNDVIDVDKNDVVIDNFVIRDGTTCIDVQFRDRINITNCDIYSDAANSRGIYLHSGANDVVITNCKIHDCASDGISVSSSDNLVIDNCEIYNNDDHGVSLSSSDNFGITNCTVSLNGLDGVNINNGYGIGVGKGIRNSTISWNGQHGIHIDSPSGPNLARDCEIHNNSDSGVHTYNSNPASPTHIFYCNLYGNKEGINISSSQRSQIMWNNIHSNSEYGVSLFSSFNDNEIALCSISSNGIAGISLRSSTDNTFDNCEIYSNGDGITINSSSDDNTFGGCEIYSSIEHGILIDSSDNNDITNCDIRGNMYGINISAGSNNEIFHNNFENNGANAYDEGDNIWNDSAGYPNYGNHWADFDEGDEGAYDFYSGPLQDILGSDGIVDTNYSISGGDNQDTYPIGGGKNDVRPYYIDYWNPYGESVILVNISLQQPKNKYIYMYHGCNKPLFHIHNHTIGDVSEFWDDFNNDTSVDEKWFKFVDTGSTIDVSNGFIHFTALTHSPHITTRDYTIPEINEPPRETPPSVTVNETLYIIETKMKINDGEGNMFFLAEPIDPEPYDRSYLLSTNTTSNRFLAIYKIFNTDPTPIIVEEIDYNSAIPLLNDWFRMRSYVHVSKTCHHPDSITTYWNEIVTIDSHLYNFETFAEEGNVLAVDIKNGVLPDDPSGDPHMTGKIGLGCSLMFPSSSSNILVDWIRVLKSPVVPPTVEIGATESINYGWEDTVDLFAENRQSLDPFDPGPVLCDFNGGEDEETFIIKNLPSNTYTVTITKGDSWGPRKAISVEIQNNDGTEVYGKMEFSDTDEGIFETKTVTITKPDNEDLNIVFATAGGGTSWIVNAMTIERGGKGVRVGLDYL
jgi:parallel beta-helix repeat protein